MPKVSFFNKISNRLIIIFLIPILLLVIFFGITIYYIVETGFQNELSKRLVTIGFSVKELLNINNLAFFKTGDEDLLIYRKNLEKLQKIKAANEVSRIYVFNEKNQLILSSEKEFLLGTPYPRLQFFKTEVKKALEAGFSTTFLYRGVDNKLYMTSFILLNKTGDQFFLAAVEGNAQFFNVLNHVKRNILRLLLLGIVMVVITSIIFSRRIVLPIRNLINALQLMSDGKLEVGVANVNSDEIGFLTVKFNEMQKKIVERDNRLKMMLSGIAHEVRNPLGGIELFIGLLEEELHNRETALGHLAKIKFETENLKNLVTEFLNYARNVDLEIKEIDLKDFFEEIIFNLSEEINEKKIRIELFKESKKGSMDPVHMRRAVFNIFRNAIQAVQKEEGVISVNVMNEKHLKGDKYIDCTVISIKDNGSGIDPSIRDRIFNPFFTTKEKGTGLGLAFVKKIVEEHNGEISVISLKGKGTSIFISLPNLPLNPEEADF